MKLNTYVLKNVNQFKWNWLQMLPGKYFSKICWHLLKWVIINLTDLIDLIKVEHDAIYTNILLWLTNFSTVVTIFDTSKKGFCHMTMILILNLPQPIPLKKKNKKRKRELSWALTLHVWCKKKKWLFDKEKNQMITMEKYENNLICISILYNVI